MTATEETSPVPTKTFLATYVTEGLSRKVWIEAPSFDAAKAICATWGVGLIGSSEQPHLVTDLPESYDEATARILLGNISKSTLYRELQDNKLDRVPGIRRILITRQSLERRKNWRARRKSA